MVKRIEPVVEFGFEAVRYFGFVVNEVVQLLGVLGDVIEFA